MRLGQREGDALVLADRPAEDDALVGVRDRSANGDPADAERLGRDQDALGVEPVEQVAEAVALLADAVVDGHGQVVVAHLARHDGVAAHLGDRRMSTSGRCRSARSSVMPSVRRAHSSSGVVRTSSRTFSQSGALVVQTLRPAHDVVVAVEARPAS